MSGAPPGALDAGARNRPVVLAAGPAFAAVGASLERAMYPAELLIRFDAGEASALAGMRAVDLVVLDQALGVTGCESVIVAARSARPEQSPRTVLCLVPTADPTEARALVARCAVDQLLVQPLSAEDLAQRLLPLLDLEPNGRAADAARVRAGVAGLWARFEGTMRERLHTLERAREEVAGGRLSAETRQAAERDAHRFAGSLGMFGLPDGSRVAREIERLLTGDAALGQDAVERIAELVAELRLLLERALAGAGDPVRQVASAAPRLLVAGAGTDLAMAVTAAATARGFEVDVAADSATVGSILARSRADAALVELAPDQVFGYDILQVIHAAEAPPPVIVLTASDQLLDRVRSAKLGARLFLRTPLPPEQIVAEVEQLIRRATSTGCRVLLVDDDPITLSGVRSLLEQADMRVASISDPLDLWNALETFAPDLIVLDLDMPVLGGIELCRVIRSDGRWKSVPILVLTAHNDAATVQRVFTAGADDFVSKPVIGPELLTRIRNRIERQQLLRSLADTDALTGAANRRKAAELLEQLRRLAERHEQPLSVVLLDLDGFKAINDSYGHAAGDQVLRQLAAALHGWFRGEDVIGRWGGEEFVLGMYGMPANDARRRLLEVLESFAAEPIIVDGHRFTATFSAGVAEYPRHGTDMSRLLQTADAALYRAKAEGKRRVEVGGI